VRGPTSAADVIPDFKERNSRPVTGRSDKQQRHPRCPGRTGAGAKLGLLASVLCLFLALVSLAAAGDAGHGIAPDGGPNAVLATATGDGAALDHEDPADRSLIRATRQFRPATDGKVPALASPPPAFPAAAPALRGRSCRGARAVASASRPFPQRRRTRNPPRAPPAPVLT